MSHSALLNDVGTQLVTRYATLSQLPSSGSWTLGTNIRLEKPDSATERSGVTRAIPEQCVWLFWTTGLESLSANDATEFYRWGLMATVRGNKRKDVETRTLAYNTWLALHKNPPSGYTDLRCLGSGPLGPFVDESGHPTWTVNMIVSQRE